MQQQLHILNVHCRVIIENKLYLTWDPPERKC